MFKYNSQNNSPENKTCSMFYRNKKKSVNNFKTPLCSDNVRKNNNIIYTQQNQNYLDLIKARYNNNNNDNEENIITPKKRTSTIVTSKSSLISNFDNINHNTIINDNDKNIKDDNKIKVLTLTNEKINLNNNNIKLLEILNENNKKNIELKNYIEEHKKKGLLAKAKFLGLLDKLKHRSKEINFENDNFYKKNINYQNLDEIKKENEYLIQKIKNKNYDFQNLYDFIMEIISSSEPYLKECQDNVNELNLFKNEKIKEVGDSFNNKISNEINNMKKDYENLKMKYNELIEKMKNEDDKEEPLKQKVKFVVKNIAEQTINEYETKIKKLKDENNKLKNDYKNEVDNLKKQINDLKNKSINKDKEYNLLNDKYQKILDNLKEKLGIKDNNPNEDI